MGRIREEGYFCGGGSEVGGDAGALLVTIDPRPFEVALAQARADLAEAASGARNASDQARRYTGLNRTGGASKEQYEQYVTVAQKAASRVESAEAAVRQAGLQLEYGTIHAAISGRRGPPAGTGSAG